MTLQSLLCAGAVFCALMSSAASAQTPLGADVFASHCALCHSSNNPDALGPNLVEHAPADFAAFAQIVRTGRSGEAGDMPSFDTRAVSDAELQALHAYLMSLRQQQQAPAH